MHKAHTDTSTIKFKNVSSVGAISESRLYGVIAGNLPESC